jgi:hypothetical protein
MPSTATAQPVMRELSRRTSGALVIALVWDAIKDAVILSVDDLSTGDRIRVEPPRGQERYAFEHPFGYLSALPRAGG